MADRPTPAEEATMTAEITKQIADTQAMIARGENPFAPKPTPEKKDAPAPEPLPVIKVTTLAPGETDPADTAKVADDLMARGGGTARRAEIYPACDSAARPPCKRGWC